jgi:hypothetical protein
MAVRDAVMQMDISDRPFVVFRNASSGKLNVVYWRDEAPLGGRTASSRRRQSEVGT